LIPAFPLAGFLILLFGRRLGDPKAGYLATAMVFASFAVVAGHLLRSAVAQPEEERQTVVTLFSWVPVGTLQVDLAFLADPLSIAMCLFVTFIAGWIHMFAVGYMHGDPKFSKFFLYLNLFVFSMTILVLGENLLVTFLGWEGVGTCSYLLIAFWHTRESAATAGKKAFVTNRVGDWGVMLAMFLSFSAVGSVSYSVLNESAETGELAQRRRPRRSPCLLFVGAIGKSAQLPLYIWLPDAMEGPTPVSALIHAATMVTGGVFLLTRVNPVIAAPYDWVPTDDRLGRRDHGAVRRDDRACPERHQEGARLLDGVADRVHVARRRHRRVRGRDLPHGHPRLLQGAAVPRLRLGHPRHARRAGHAQDGRAAQVHADHRARSSSAGWRSPVCHRSPASGRRTRSCCSRWPRARRCT
jgi:hypothetical protein